MAVWKDIDIQLRKKKDGDILDMEEVDAIKNSLRNITTTLQGQRRMLPEFAMPIYDLLFEPMDDLTAQRLGSAVWEAIEFWDDRVDITGLYITPNYDEHRYEVNLTFRVKTSENEESLDFILYQK